MNLYESGWEDVDWVNLAYDRGQALKGVVKKGNIISGSKLYIN
jgi:hypothetical protein